ncbi:MAG: class I SAM-dependent methyltransferase [Elusimicrobiota bacterium]|nr:MAG: class I SAM-dependent methyltransferase [Elusimicrobiota bacterium]
MLDLGGGSLLSLPDLVADPRVSSWTVVDLVDRLGERPPRVSFVKSDAARFVADWSGEPFDAVVCFGLLMYLPSDAARGLLDALPRVMKPGAALLSHEPNASAAGHLERGLERTAAEPAEPRGWRVELREAHNHPLLWAAAARLNAPALWEGAAGDLLLAAEARLGGGLDDLAVLRPDAARR